MAGLPAGLAELARRQQGLQIFLSVCQVRCDAPAADVSNCASCCRSRLSGSGLCCCKAAAATASAAAQPAAQARQQRPEGLLRAALLPNHRQLNNNDGQPICISRLLSVSRLLRRSIGAAGLAEELHKSVLWLPGCKRLDLRWEEARAGQRSGVSYR